MQNNKLSQDLITPDLYSLDKSQLIELLQSETAKRHLLETQLQQLTTHLNNCQRIAHVGSWELNLNGPDLSSESVFWSRETFNILGLDPETHKPTRDCFVHTTHPEDRQNVLYATETALKEGRQTDIEYRVVLANGIEKVVRSISEIVADPLAEQSVKVIGVTQDITDKVLSNKQLQYAHSELKTLFERISEVLYTVDMEHHRLIQISAACERVYGYSVNEFYENPNLWFDVILEEDRPIIQANNEPLAEGKSIIQIYRIHHKNGTIRWLQSKLEPLLNEEGKLVRLDGITSDITKKVEAQMALKNSELRFRSLIQNLTDGIAISNLNNEIVFASESLARITGYTAGEISQMQIHQSIHPDDLPKLLSDRQQFSNPGAIMKFTFRFRRKDGEWIWIEGVSQNLIADPAIGGIVTNYRDITEQVRYEEALRQSNEYLKKTNNELDRFVYSVSHDLRAPLASILGAIDYSECETADPDMLENLALMKTSAEKLDGFILDILDYSRNARTEVNSEEIDFRELFNDVKTHLKFMGTGNRNVDVRLVIESKRPFYSDRSRLSVVLNNLISNGIRYCNPVEEQPFVLLHVSSDDNGTTLSIADNGIGIDLKYHEKIFDMFYRVSQKSAGSGLGLYIVKETVEKLRGTLRFESEPGKGTKFIIFLPDLNK